MATGRPPWSEFSNRASDIIKIISMPGRLPSIPNVAQDIQDLIKECLIRDPELRPTAKQLLSHSCITNYSLCASNNFISKKATKATINI